MVAEEGNIHRAAARLGVSQPPISRQVQDLAGEMGVALLEPAGRGIKLTAAGRRFAERARAILASVDAAVAEARGVASGQLGTVAIGFETGAILSGGLLASIVTSFRQRVPRVELDLRPMSSVEQWAALRAGTIDFGYGYDFPIGDGALRHLRIASDRLGVVVSADHRLAQRSRLRIKDLVSERVLLQPRQLYPRLHDDIIAAARAQGVVLDVRSGAVDGEALLTQVVIGEAVSFLGERSSAVLGLTPVVWRPVSDLHVSETHVVLWRADDDGPLIRSLLDCAREARAARRQEPAVWRVTRRKGVFAPTTSATSTGAPPAPKTRAGQR
jgi:DNA-binding transcriptional LysR family regulator